MHRTREGVELVCRLKKYNGAKRQASEKLPFTVPATKTKGRAAGFNLSNGEMTVLAKRV